MSTDTSNQFTIPTKAIFNKSAFEQFKFYTKLYGKNEWGGLCIGFQKDEVFYVRSIVLPPQKTQSQGFCEFRKELFPLISKHLFRLQDEHKGFTDYRIGAWIHTHPGFGVFFSGTDVDTFKYLTSLAPDYLGVVVDPIKDEVVGFNSRIIEHTVKDSEEDLEESDISDEDAEEKEAIVEVSEDEASLEDATDDSSEVEEALEEAIEKDDVKKLKVQTTFEKIEVDFDDPEIENVDKEELFLNDLRKGISSLQSAKEIGDRTPVEVFVPLEEKDHFIRTMGFRVEYLEKTIQDLETKIADLSHLTEYVEDMSTQHSELQNWYYASRIKYRDVTVPLMLLLNKNGVHFSISEKGLVRDYRISWKHISRVESVILQKQPVPQYRAELNIILVNLELKKKGFFSKPETKRLLLFTYEHAKYRRCLLEFASDSHFRNAITHDFEIPTPKEEPDIDEIDEDVELLDDDDDMDDDDLLEEVDIDKDTDEDSEDEDDDEISDESETDDQTFE